MFLHHLVEFGNCPPTICELNHHWHGINVLSLLECALLASCLGLLLALFFRVVRRSKRLTTLALIGSLSFATAAYAANTALSALSASGALAGANLIYVVQTAGVGGVKATMTQVATFINSLFSGDFTVTSGGVATLKNTGPGATGPIGSATVAPIVTIDAQGRVTALSSASITQPAGANPTATAGPTANNGVASTFMRSDASPAVQLGTAAQKGIVQVDGTTITATGGVISAAVGAVSSVTGGIGISVSPTTGNVVVSATATQRNNTLTSDTLLGSDAGTVVTENNASPVAVGIAAAGGTGFEINKYWTVKNKGAGLVTITPTTSTIDGAATLTLKQLQSVDFYSDGTNYWTMPGRPTNIACSDLSNATALCSTAPGTGVAAALGNTLSSAGGLASTIASGTSALGTSAIASAACATVVTTSAPNTATTDVVTASFNGDPTAVTGYIPATAGMLTIFSYPTSGNVNFKVCNNTASSITPGAITLNWRVLR